MNTLLKIVAGITLVALFAVPISGVFAQADNPDPNAEVGGVTPQGPPNVDAKGMWLLIQKIVNWIFTLLLVLVFIMIIVAAFIFVTSGSNPDSVTKARQILIMALVGFAVAMVAKGIVSLAYAILGGKEATVTPLNVK